MKRSALLLVLAAALVLAIHRLSREVERKGTVVIALVLAVIGAWLLQTRDP